MKAGDAKTDLPSDFSQPPGIVRFTSVRFPHLAYIVTGSLQRRLVGYQVVDISASPQEFSWFPWIYETSCVKHMERMGSSMIISVADFTAP